MPFILLMGLVNLGLIAHCYKTGRDRWWIFVLLLFPGISTAAYIVMELLPDLMHTMTGRRVATKLRRVLNPKGEVNRLTDDLTRTGDVASRCRLADELIERGDYAGAEKLYNEARSGLFEQDPTVMLGHARALFGLARYQDVITVLDDLIKAHPTFRNQDGHLLFARAHAEVGHHQEAVSEFDTLMEYFAGPEAHIRYAQYLETQGNTAKAAKLYQAVMETSRLSPAHYRRTHRHWIGLAKKALKP